MRFLPTLTGLFVVHMLTSTARCDDWVQAAGPGGNFIVEGKAPLSFSVASDEGVLWRVPLPNTGQGSVIVSGGRVFVASHAPTKEDAQMGSLVIGQCFDAKTGQELWRRELPGARVTDLSSLFSDNTAASPVADGKRVCFTNVGGSMKCFDFDGKELWSKQWVPFGRHHSRQHEPILHEGKVIVVRVKPSDLDPKATTKDGAKPLGRDRAYWTWLHAYDLKTGKLVWTGESGTGIHATPLPGLRADGSAAILTARGGGHQPPEEPYGISLLNASNGKTIRDLEVKGYASHQNACWNSGLAALFVGKNHQTVDLSNGKIRDKVSLSEGVQICRQVDGRYITESHQKLAVSKKPITYQTNLLVGNYHYFRSFKGFHIGRVNVTTGKVEYLEVPVQVVHAKNSEDKTLWQKALPNDMRNAQGFLATQDKRNAGSGWGHCSAASPTVIGEYLYMPTMIGMVYVLKWNAPVLDEKALVSISDLGPAGKTWSLSSLSYSDGLIYARTMKELICIGSAGGPDEAAGGSGISRKIGSAEPFFERWDEGDFHGPMDVAMDGTVLIFSVRGDKDGDKIYLKRSEDGGTSWSDHQYIGKHVELDWKALNIGPYDGEGWGRDKKFAFASLGTTVVDENTGEIMFFMTALHPAPYMYKSQDHGKTWKLEKIEFKKDSRGYLTNPNPACDPGITIKHGPHKGRLLAPARVMVDYNKHAEAKGYTNAVYSDDHGKTWFSSEPFPLDGTGESGLVELSDGTIYFNSRTHTRKGNRWIAYSDDSGETWRDCHQDDELFDGPPDMYGCKAALLRLDRDDGDILLFSSPDPSLPEKQNRANLNVWASFDGGITWPVNRLIKEGPGNYSWMTQGRKGTPSEGFIYVRSIEGGMARFNMAWLLQPDDKKAGKYAFGKASPAGDNRTSIGPSDDRFVLPPRHDYRMLQKPPFVKSVNNAKLFKISDDRLKRIETGYQLIDAKAKGHVLPHKICLPGKEIKISCDVSAGSLTISLLDPAGKLIKTSKPLTGGLKVGEPVQWPDGFKLDQYVATPLTVRFDLEGEAKLYDIGFDELFWE